MSSIYPPYGGPPAKLCLHCGAPLPANVVTCVNCGTYNPLTQPGTNSHQGQAQLEGLQSQASFNGGQYTGRPSGQPFVSSTQYNQWGQSSVLPQDNGYDASYAPQFSPPVNNNFYPIPGQNPQSNFTNFNAAPQQNASYSAPMIPNDGYIQSPQQKHGPGVGFIFGVILLIVLLIGGAFTGYFYFTHHYSNSAQYSTPTSTTPSIVVTPTAIPLFTDSFANNNMGWDLTSYAGKFSVKVGGGSLVLEDDQNKLFWEVLPGKSFTNFRLDVNASLTKGDPNNGYGVFIRASNQGNDLGTYYRFELYGDGTYAIFKGYLDNSGKTQSTKVQGYTAHTAIAKVGQVNHITIIAKGPAMTMMVNGQSMYTYTDDGYKSGSVALFVSNLPGLTPVAQATFTRLAIFPVPQ
jgi:3-keto-disaccharide hydrolase